MFILLLCVCVAYFTSFFVRACSNIYKGAVCVGLDTKLSFWRRATDNTRLKVLDRERPL